MVTRGVVGANEASASGLGGSRSVWVPHVIIAHSLEVARACEQDVAESAVGACVDALELEGYVRIATRARHANLLCLFRRRFPSLACLVAGVSSAVAGPLLENVTCSSPSLNSSTKRAQVPFTRHCRYKFQACWEVVREPLLLLCGG